MNPMTFISIEPTPLKSQQMLRCPVRSNTNIFTIIRKGKGPLLDSSLDPVYCFLEDNKCIS